jgi:hypothetical protein
MQQNKLYTKSTVDRVWIFDKVLMKCYNVFKITQSTKRALKINEKVSAT